MRYVYVLFNKTNSSDTYLGYTSNLKRRVRDHNADKNRSTQGRQWQLVYYEAYVSERIARDRERKLKHDGACETISDSTNQKSIRSNLVAG